MILCNSIVAVIEVVEVSRRFVEDKSDVKENLSVGGYRNDKGQIHLMEVVRKAEEAIVSDKGLGLVLKKSA